MQYRITDSRYITDKDTQIIFASNDKQEAIYVAQDVGSGAVVLRIDESGLEEIVFIASYRKYLGIAG